MYDYTQMDEVLRKYYADKPDFSLSTKINHTVKRTLDVILGSAGIIVSAPIIAVMGLVTLYDAGDPAFFKQERIGYRGNHITIYKIRTMHNGTEEKILRGELKLRDIYSESRSSPVYTKIGRILDYTHLNELPQLWNVLKGEMSIVGNRPQPLHEVNALIDLPGFIDRFDSKPGLIGYSQLKPQPINILDVIPIEKDYSKTYNTGNILKSDFNIMLQTIKMYSDILRFKNFKFDYRKITQVPGDLSI